MPGRENRAARGSLAAVGPGHSLSAARFRPCAGGHLMRRARALRRHPRVTCHPNRLPRGAQTGERPRGLSALKGSAMRPGPGIRLRPCSLSWRIWVPRIGRRNPYRFEEDRWGFGGRDEEGTALGVPRAEPRTRLPAWRSRTTSTSTARRAGSSSPSRRSTRSSSGPFEREKPQEASSPTREPTTPA